MRVIEQIHHVVISEKQDPTEMVIFGTPNG